MGQTYAEYAQILRNVLRRKGDAGTMLLRSHVELAKAEVRKITLHKLAIGRSTPEAVSATGEAGRTGTTRRDDARNRVTSRARRQTSGRP
jgi:hypothetical protein